MSSKSKSQRVLCLMGPTAAGKTDLAIEIAKKIPANIISVDSAMIYRGMNIGSGKPEAEILKQFPHGLVDIKDPTESYSAAEFCHDANILIEQSWSQDKLPILVGGTMLYFKALQGGLANLPVANPSIRSKIMQEAQQLGWEAMHQKLLKIDPTAAKNIKSADRQRIQRALEVYLSSGRTISDFWQEEIIESNVEFINIILWPDRPLLHERIVERFNKMLEHGFVQEVEELMIKYPKLDLTYPALRSVGYRQIWQYLNNEFSHEEMIFKATCATRQLAKRQYTWLRTWDQRVEQNNIKMNFIPSDRLDDQQKIVEQVLGSMLY